MYNIQQNPLNILIIDEILIYLRKSRQDDPNETVEEVLSRHEVQLQDFAVKTWGARIPESNIYREVVSGETIDDRPEIKKVIDRVQESKIKAVLVIEPQRLTRGDLLDCGTIVHVLRYTNTLCITPTRFYNLDDKYDRRYFEDELKRGNDFLEYTKEILMRGRRLSASQGYWVLPRAPFGYDRERQKNRKYILVPNENAANVRMMFEWFADGISKYEIARRLLSSGVKPLRNKSVKWHVTTIEWILKNDVYIGVVRFGETKEVRVYENGTLKKKRVSAPESEHIVAKGLHDPIIPLGLWTRVQERLGSCDRTNSKHELSNPLAGLVVCKKCGYIMRATGKPIGKRRRRVVCSIAPQCSTKSIDFHELLEAVQSALYANIAVIEEKVRTGAESGREAREAQLAALEAHMQKLQDQEENQYDLLERKEYTPEVFNRRHSKLVKEMEAVQKAIETARATLPEVIDYEDALIRLHDAVEAMKNPDMTSLEKNMILKSIVSRIEYSREKGKINNSFDLDVFLKL